MSQEARNSGESKGTRKIKPGIGIQDGEGEDSDKENIESEGKSEVGVKEETKIKIR